MPLPLIAIPAIAAAGGTFASSLGNSITGSSEANNIRNAYQNYMNYLNGISSQMADELTARADKYDNKLQALQQTGESQFVNEANTQLPELTQLVKDIATQSAEAQRQNRLQTQTELAQQGIRGGQAATLANRATGELNRNLQRDINQTVYNEAANRQNSRLNYYGQKGLVPYSAMSSGYGQSMVGANNALSYAQGNTYAKAYENAMNAFLGTQNMNATGAAKYLGGGLSMLGGAINTGVDTGLKTLDSIGNFTKGLGTYQSAINQANKAKANT